MKTIIHVSQPNIRLNIKEDKPSRPVITAKTYNTNRYGYEVGICDDQGNEVARVVYSHNKPLSCGARVWIETYNEVKVYDNDGNEVTNSNVSECYLSKN